MSSTNKADNSSTKTSVGSRTSVNNGVNGRNGRLLPRFSLRRFFCRRPSMSGRSSKSGDVPDTRSLASIGIMKDASDSLNNSYLSGMPDITGDSIHSTGSIAAASSSDTSYNGKQRECGVCVTVQPANCFPKLSTCHHRACRDCLRKYLYIEITESRVQVACPECSELMHPNDICQIISQQSLIDKYEAFMLRRVLVSDPDTRWCPAPDCSYAVLATGCASCPKIVCARPGCDTAFCYHCKQKWHPNQTCLAARNERANQLFFSGLNSLRSNLRASVSYTTYSHDAPDNKEHVDIKPCPRCSAFITKLDDGSCNHMTCTMCAAEFCWLCMKEISDLHYLSPSGCTFWGKKPWSRKKKVIWQLGTLVGAPLGISLFAGVAIPSIIIGVPVWVWHKLHNRYENAPRHKRNLLITGGVTASIIISPLVAAITVGIGVPILLAYVYGVVPIALCRSGCGMSTTHQGGVRFEFDEEHEPHATLTGTYGGDGHSMASASQHINPSIAPSIGEVSLAMTNSLLSASASHLERSGIPTTISMDGTDRDSASRQVLTGASLDGSLGGNVTSYTNKLEVHADFTTHCPTSTAPIATGDPHKSDQRSNFSCESAVSITLSGDAKLDTKSDIRSDGKSDGRSDGRSDCKSLSVSFCDDASTKALAGSICNNPTVSYNPNDGSYATSPTSTTSGGINYKYKSQSSASVNSNSTKYESNIRRKRTAKTNEAMRPTDSIEDADNDTLASDCSMNATNHTHVASKLVEVVCDKPESSATRSRIVPKTLSYMSCHDNVEYFNEKSPTTRRQACPEENC